MSRRIASGLAGLVILLYAFSSFAAETLEDALHAARIPTQPFAASELGQKITSYATSDGDSFLLAYYTDDGPQRLKPPLHVIRYSRSTGNLQKADLRDIGALFQGEIRMDCLGSALKIREYRGIVYVDTHLNPSAGCAVILSPGLVFQAALSGWIVGLMGADYAILQRSEIHFMSVHPMHLAVFDLQRNRSAEVYPFPGDPLRRQFSRLIEPHISDKWCMESNAQCDPENFNTSLKGELAVNEAARVFGFDAEFDAEGFGDAAAKQAPPRTVTYIFRERSGTWEHREFQPHQLQALFGVTSIQELVAKKPDAPFETSSRK